MKMKDVDKEVNGDEWRAYVRLRVAHRAGKRPVGPYPETVQHIGVVWTTYRMLMKRPVPDPFLLRSLQRSRQQLMRKVGQAR